MLVAIHYMIFETRINILFTIKVKISMLLKWSYRHPPQKKEEVMLTIEPRSTQTREPNGKDSNERRMKIWTTSGKSPRQQRATWPHERREPRLASHRLLLDKQHILSTQSSFFQTHVFFMPILKPTPNHIPLKYMCPNYWCVRFRHVPSLYI